MFEERGGACHSSRFFRIKGSRLEYMAAPYLLFLIAGRGRTTCARPRFWVASQCESEREYAYMSLGDRYRWRVRRVGCSGLDGVFLGVRVI